jgi:nucleoside 2-deoxyribosyltransferase
MSSQKPKVYLAGPIQHSQSRGKGWRARVKENFDGIEWVDPIDKYDHEAEAAEWEDEKIVAEDKALILDSHAVLLHYEKVPSWGTPREQEFAVNKGRPVFVQTTEEDPSPWLTVDAETVQETFEDVVWHIKAYFDVAQQQQQSIERATSVVEQADSILEQ